MVLGLRQKLRMSLYIKTAPVANCCHGNSPKGVMFGVTMTHLIIFFVIATLTSRVPKWQ